MFYGLVGVVYVLRFGGCGLCSTVWWVWFMFYGLVGVVYVLRFGGCGLNSMVLWVCFSHISCAIHR